MPTALAAVLYKLKKDEVTLATDLGWWRRPERITFGQHETIETLPPAATLLELAATINA